MQNIKHTVGLIRIVKGDYLDVKTAKVKIKKIREMKDPQNDYFC